MPVLHTPPEIRDIQQKVSEDWIGWLWESCVTNSLPDPTDDAVNDEQVRRIFRALDIGKDSPLLFVIAVLRDLLNIHLALKLDKGSFTFRTGLDSEDATVTTSYDLHIDGAGSLSRFILSVSLGSFGAVDCTSLSKTPRQIVHVKDAKYFDPRMETLPLDLAIINRFSKPFLALNVEFIPLDKRYDATVTVDMRHPIMVDLRGCIDAATRFLKPPSGSLKILFVCSLKNRASRYSCCL